MYPSTNRRADIACIGNDDKLLYIFEICYTNPTLETSRPKDVEWFDIDAKEIIIQLNANEIIDYTQDGIKKDTEIVLECKRKFLCDNCWSNTIFNDPKGLIYFNQRGAGCGKTYESIQLLNSEDPNYVDKTVFIYLTKMNSAVKVVYDELISQYDNGKLDGLTMVNSKNGYCWNKKYVIPFTTKTKKIQVLIGTIDSFAWAVHSKEDNVCHYDKFKGIILTIRNGDLDLKEGNITYYANKETILSKDCLIIIDEAQDLGKEYIEAFDKIIEKTNIDVYVIGDKLQSIWGEENIYTYIEKNAENLNSRIIRSDGKNIVMRFHNEQFISFVNDVVLFEKYNLPSIKGICNGFCNYVHENNKTPYTIFEIPSLNKCKDEQYKTYSSNVNLSIKKILEFMDIEIKKYGYLPKNFMFIFPIVSKNTYAQNLFEKLQCFWIKTFKDEKFRKNIEPNNYWLDRLDEKTFNQYVYLHKSDEGSSINLKESEHSSRIISIHTSKGIGCEVVFFLGVSEQYFNIFTHNKKNLVYESLLHVGLTRQKKSLYIGVTNNYCDNIRLRFEKFEIIKDENLKPEPLSLYIKSDIEKIITYLETDSDLFNEFSKNFPIFEQHRQKLKKDHKEKQIIDMGHHLFRSSTLYIMFIWKILENSEYNSCKQYHAKISKLKKSTFTLCNYNENKLKLIKINQINYHEIHCKEKCTDKCQIKSRYLQNLDIPILNFDKDKKSKYYFYAIILKNMIEHLIKKMNEYKKDIPICPIECLILYFLLKISHNGYFSEIQCIDIYQILSYYELCINYFHERNDYDCICNKSLNPGNNKIIETSEMKKIKESVRNHYEKLKNIPTIYTEYEEFLKKISISKIEYNMFHSVWMTDNNFKLKYICPFIGYSDNEIFYFIFKPQYNEININKILSEVIFANFLILNCDDGTNNKKRYENKKIYTCTITLETKQPIIEQIYINGKDERITKIIKISLFDEYSKYHPIIFEHYSTIGLESMLEDINIDNKKYPYYISSYFRSLDKKIKKAKKNKKDVEKIINKYVGSKEILIERLNDDLDMAIDDFLEIDIQDE